LLLDCFVAPLLAMTVSEAIQITPARAGEALLANGMAAKPRDHPRSRGGSSLVIASGNEAIQIIPAPGCAPNSLADRVKWAANSIYMAQKAL
jgi:hypothetical protein